MAPRIDPSTRPGTHRPTRFALLSGVFVFCALAVWCRPAAAQAADEAPAEALDMSVIDHVPDLPRSAILRFIGNDLEDWHYTRTRESEEGRLTDRHDPDLPGEAHWQLVSVDGRAPTEDEVRDYEKDRADHSDREQRASRAEMMQVLAPGSVRLLDVSDGVHRYAYRLRSPDGRRERVYQALEGELEVVDDAGGPWVREVRLWNTDVLRPILGVRIDAADLRFEFALRDGWVLPVAVDARWEGEFLMLKDLGTDLRFTLSDFRRVDTPGPAADPESLTLP